MAQQKEINPRQMFGRFVEVVMAILGTVFELGGTFEDLERFRKRLKEDVKLRKQLAELILDRPKQITAAAVGGVMGLNFSRRLTLTIGGIPKDGLLQRLANTGNEVTQWANDIMGKPAFTTQPKPIQIGLGWARVKDLGFTEPPTTIELLARVREVGDVCPAEAGPHLRIVDDEQANGTAYWVMMEPISDSDGFPIVFGVGRDDGGKRWLSARCASPGDRWNLGDVVVFVSRK